MSKKPSKELQNEWRQKLKDSGFEDIEDSDGNIDRGTWDFRSKNFIENYKIKLDYYYNATQFLNDYKFESKRDRLVWMYHSEGLTEVAIFDILTKLKIHISLTQVGYHIRKLNREMREFYGNKGV